MLIQLHHWQNTLTSFDEEKKKREAEGQSSEDASNNKDKEEQEITPRPLNMEDMRQAKSQVG
ncbi:hypothetical protein JHK84_045833 [Glycine max]|nr:hypothetical protein JHK84_045833 [Glycine max]